jgi:Ca-activated chloride channel family protein
MIAEMRSDRVGFIIFAGNSYLQMPLTVDYSAFEMYLRSVNTDIIPTQGTAIGKSIDLALQAFEGEQQKHKALVIISDGEDFEGDVYEKAKEAAKTGVKIFTIGVGTPKGAPIPVYNKFGQKVDYKKDNSGSIILTKIDEQTLQQLAAHGNGQYFRLVGRETTKALFDELSKVEKKEIEELIYTDYEEQFQYFLLLGLIFVLIEILITHKKSSFIKKLKLFEE